MIHRLVKYVVILMAAGTIGLLLFVLAFLLPTERIQDHVDASIGQLQQETPRFSAFGMDMSGSQQDNFSDALFLTGALVGHHEGVLCDALACYSYITDDKAVHDLSVQLNEGEISDNLNRFWCGWLVPLKILLQFTRYSYIRYINFVMQSILLYIIGILLCKRNLSCYFPGFLLSVFFMNPVTMALTMAYTGFYYEILLSSIVMLKYNDTLYRKSMYSIFFYILGILSFYFNPNYFQLCVFGFSLILYFILNSVDSLKAVFRTCIHYMLLWLCGYVGMMILKWILYAVVVDRSIFNEVWNLFLFRMGSSDNGRQLSRLSAIQVNIEEGFGNRFFLFVEAVFILSMLFLAIKNRLDFHNVIPELFVVLFSVLIVLGRYFLEANHSYVHNWIMYRNLAVVVFALNSFVTKISTPMQK